VSGVLGLPHNNFEGLVPGLPAQCQICSRRPDPARLLQAVNWGDYRYEYGSGQYGNVPPWVPESEIVALDADHAAVNDVVVLTGDIHSSWAVSGQSRSILAAIQARCVSPRCRRLT